MRVRGAQTGVTYLAVLCTVALAGMMLAATGLSWSKAQQRTKERELLFIGNAFRRAIGNYYENTPGTVKRYPHSLEELTLDQRQLAPTRYLRRIYRDPMTGQASWGLIRGSDGDIIGVHSLSTEQAAKVSQFRQRDCELAGHNRYSDWRFIYHPLASGKAP